LYCITYSGCLPWKCFSLYHPFYLYCIFIGYVRKYSPLFFFYWKITILEVLVNFWIHDEILKLTFTLWLFYSAWFLFLMKEQWNFKLSFLNFRKFAINNIHTHFWPLLSLNPGFWICLPSILCCVDVYAVPFKIIRARNDTFLCINRNYMNSFYECSVTEHSC